MFYLLTVDYFSFCELYDPKMHAYCIKDAAIFAKGSIELNWKIRMSVFASYKLD